MRYTDTDIAVVETLIRDAMPRATEAEVAAILERCGGRTLHPDTGGLLRPFGPRDRESNRVDRIGQLVGCLLTGHRNGWYSSDIRSADRRLVDTQANRTA